MGLRQRIRGAALGAFIGPGVQRLEIAVHRLLTPLGRRRLALYARADDPYSALLAQLAGELASRYNVDVGWVPIGTPGREVEPEPELRQRYAVRDCRELARYYEVDFPLDGPEQPDSGVFERAGAMWAGCDSHDNEAIAEIGLAIWSGDELALARAEARWPPIGARESAEVLAANSRQARRRGHYQGAMIYLDGLWAWGPDRLHYIERELGGPGVEPLFRRRSEPIGLDGAPPADPSRLEMFHSFRSPYSYLAIEPTFALADRLGLELEIRPVLPMVMRGMPVPFAKRFYIARDAMREARRLDIPFGQICDPVGRGVERCMALFEVAAAQDRARELILSVGRGVWSEALDTTDDADLQLIADRAGLSIDVSRDLPPGESWRSWAEANREALFGAGLWGVPSYRTGELAVWGQDRLWLIERRILERR